jgi:5-methylthioribose kinase
VAFLLALVVLDGIRHRERAFVREAPRFWGTYTKHAAGAAAAPADVVAELGCIVLARIDGKSRLPNLDGDAAERGRGFARALLFELREAGVEEALTRCP